MVKIKTNEIITWALLIFLIVIGGIVIYQLLRKIFGGSWDVESLILTLVMVNLGHSFYLGNKFAKLEAKFNYLAQGFKKLSEDFKEHAEK